MMTLEAHSSHWRAVGDILRLLPSLWPLTMAEWRHHPGRHAAAALAVALGVALAWSVHLINGSALAEFSAAARQAQTGPDQVLRAASGPHVADAVMDQLASLPAVALAGPVVEVDTYARTEATEAAPRARLAVKVFGIDALVATRLTPALMPIPASGQHRLAALDPGRVFLNAAAAARLGVAAGQSIRLQSGERWHVFEVGGHVTAGGGPLVVMDIAAAQTHFGLEGRLSRIDLRWVPGQTASLAELPDGLRLDSPREAEDRLSRLSRAYRVNLTVLALVALLVGGFLVYSVVSLSVAQRTPSLALLGVLGLTAAQRCQFILAECAVLGAMGSLAGLGLGTGLAAAALRWLGADLGGGYFPGIVPALQVDVPGLALFAGLGVLVAMLGGWIPARQAQRLPVALALKGLGSSMGGGTRSLWPWILLPAGALLALLPPIAGLPLAAYGSVALLLVGGVALVPLAVQALLAGWQPQSVLPLLAVERARQSRETATAAMAGVVASLALSVSLTVMVDSFRVGVTGWLDQILPADVYARTATSAAAGDQAWLDPGFLERAARLPGVQRVEGSRHRALPWVAGQPAVTLLARPLGDPGSALPLLSRPACIGTPEEPAVFVSEAMVDLYGAAVGAPLDLPLGTHPVRARVCGVWRDYARQFGAVAIDLDTYRTLTADHRINDLAVWLAPGAHSPEVLQALRNLVPSADQLELATTDDLRRLSLSLFDRSFAVTRYLQGVAIGIGLIGVAASLSAQVLARRKEFGLLAHLGFGRRQVLLLVAGETLCWLAAGAVVGLALGLVISVVLVHVVNPQSFHWTMPLVVPVLRLMTLAGAMLLAGLIAVTWVARAATSTLAIRSVKEDW